MKVPPAIAKLAPDGNLTPRQRRHFLIQMLLGRNGPPGSGSALEFLRSRTAMNPWPDLRSTLSDIPWVIVGGVATRAYMPERVTKDMNILVSRLNGEEARRRLEAAGYTTVTRLAVPGYLMRSPEGVKVDVLFGHEEWLEEALATPGQDAAGYPVLALPYLVLMKLTAQRTQDWADVSRMLGGATDEQLAEVRAVVARYSPVDSDDLESLIFLGKKEFEMPGSNPPEE